MNKLLFEKILELNPRAQLKDSLRLLLASHIKNGWYRDNAHELIDQTVDNLKRYREKSGLHSAVIGISGGLDSALCLNLLVKAGWQVIPVIMPIHQNPVEIGRAFQVCSAAGVEPRFIDMTATFDQLSQTEIFRDVRVSPIEPWRKDLLREAVVSQNHAALVRGGNIRARLRMMTLYHIASKNRGLVVSTDNFSELTAGFWTICGDVGDIAPLQSFTKSWEVPAMAQVLDVPQSVIAAVPTDGLGISTGDETQLGVSYLEWDIAIFSILDNAGKDNDCLATEEKMRQVHARVQNTAFKRAVPIKMAVESTEHRMNLIQQIDNQNLRY
jgi:NAD+ synthetase